MGVTIDWNGDEVTKRLIVRLERNTRKAAELVKNATIQSLNRTQPKRIFPGGGVKGLAPSLPGEPPKRLTNRLIQSIRERTFRRPNSIVGVVGTNVVYARALELGSTKVAARPFLRPALAEKRQAVLRILARR